MVAAFFPPKPLPTSPLGQKLCDLFGRQPWDFLQAPLPPPGKQVEWITIKNYPLRPRVLWQQWQNPEQLIGVRFTHETAYGLLDIDAGSPYCNPEAIIDIRAALETIGITRTLLLRSSHSNGLHLYIPLAEPVKTFDLAVALYECLKTQGFAISPGQLEIFPNVKTYGVERIIHYNGHRLPLQPGTGSCLLDDHLNPIGDNLEQFFRLWEGAAAHQAMDELRHALKIGRDNHRQKPRRARQSFNKVESWRQDLETDTAEGWTGHGQTNHLLKVIACHGHVFLGLEANDLIAHTLETALHLPGYRQYCRHQRDIHIRVQAWCKAVQHYYWPLGSEPKRDSKAKDIPALNLNEQRSQDARQRIQAAMQTLRERDALPTTTKRRAEAIVREVHISSKTLYRPENLKLWHPEHCLETSEPAEGCKSAEPAKVSASQGEVEGEKVRSLKRHDRERVYTLARSMKCGPLDKPLPQTKSFFRGVRGDWPRFPQHSEPLITPPIPFDEVQAAIQAKVHSLQWSLERVRQFLAEHFQGRSHIWQLRAHELTTYLYYLQVEGLANSRSTLDA
ncbi:MAG: hypothetical protein F6J95_027655 [Leptolyngbya sp. SIO1E4]|nr:hypothetical protein [Leptolyngbya sp. SIO1E4]